MRLSKMASIWSYVCHTAFILVPLSSIGILDGSVSAIEQNLALHKTTHQSSTLDELTSSLAVDGKKDAGSPCSQTAGESNPWWSVDLQDSYQIERVKVYFSQKSTQNIWSLSVYIQKEYTGPMSICQQNINALVHEFLPVDCKGQIGQFITVQLENMVSELQLCEVEVIGEKPSWVSPGEIVSRHFCRSKENPYQIIETVPARSRIECAVLCAQRYNCDSFYFKTNAAQRPLCQLRQMNSNSLLLNPEEEYNAC